MSGNISSIIAWRIPWTEKPGRLQSMGLQRVGQDWIDLACMHARTHTHTHAHGEFAWDHGEEMTHTLISDLRPEGTLAVQWTRKCHQGRREESWDFSLEHGAEERRLWQGRVLWPEIRTENGRDQTQSRKTRDEAVTVFQDRYWGSNSTEVLLHFIDQKTEAQEWGNWLKDTRLGQVGRDEQGLPSLWVSLGSCS